MRLKLLLLCLSTSLFCYNDDQLSSLYSGLDPSSITQHIALYKLYPELPVGQKALEHAQKLLSKCQSNKDTLAHLPLIDQSIDGFVSFMLGKSIKDDFLDNEYLDAIEALSSHLGNRSLAGHQAKSEQEVLALEAQEIDLGRAILLAQQGKDVDWVWMRNYEAQLDFLALQVLARLSEEPSSLEIIREINQVLFFDSKYRFPNQYIQNQHHKFSQLSAVLDLKQGVCLGTTIVYLCLAQRLNLPLEIITPPGHIYARYNDGKKITNIETTHRGVHVPNDNYYSVNVKFLKQIDLKETISCVYLNLGTTHLMDYDCTTAQKYYQKALQYQPNDALCTMMLGYSYAFNNEVKAAKKTFGELKKLSFKDQVSTLDLDAYKDYLKNKVDLETLKAAVLPPKEQNIEELKHRREILEKGTYKHPNFCAGWHMLSNIYIELSEPKKAIYALNKIHQINPDIPIVEFNLSMLYNEELNTPAAWKHYKNCATILKEHNIELKMMKDFKRMLQSSSIEPR
ncbi:MAG: hypothetical protein S4CHLAM6_04850 [Chlamydiae bacterium]|nr:hypothetical protein [Chlamydiota bacterium]